MNEYINGYINVLKTKYTLFTGRARRQEFWSFVLINVIIGVLLNIIGSIVGTMLLGLIFNLAVLLPSIGLGIRRLHDTNRSGWWMLIGLIPLVGLVLIVFCAMEGDKGDNQYGADPKAVAA